MIDFTYRVYLARCPWCGVAATEPGVIDHTPGFDCQSVEIGIEPAGPSTTVEWWGDGTVKVTEEE